MKIMTNVFINEIFGVCAVIIQLGVVFKINNGELELYDIGFDKLVYVYFGIELEVLLGDTVLSDVFDFEQTRSGFVSHVSV